MKINAASFTAPFRASIPRAQGVGNAGFPVLLLTAEKQSLTCSKPPLPTWMNPTLLAGFSATPAPPVLSGCQDGMEDEGVKAGPPDTCICSIICVLQRGVARLNQGLLQKREIRTAGTQHSSNKGTVLSGRAKKAKKGAATLKYMLPEAMITFTSEQFTHTHRRERFPLHVCRELAI